MKMTTSSKPAVAIYLRYYLSPSETFVYRQLQGVAPWFHPFVMTSRVSLLDVYPFDDLHVKERGFAGRVFTRMQRFLGRPWMLTPAQHREWGRLLASKHARLIHAHFGHYGMEMLPLARQHGLPLLVTFHGYDASSLLRDRSYAGALGALFDYAHVITVSHNMAERLREYGLDDSRLHVHYIGVPVDNFTFAQRTPVADKLAAGEPVEFLQVSNFVAKKGHRYTIETFARFATDRTNCALTLAGDGPLRAEAERLARELGIADRVRFVGRVVTEEVTGLMAGADVFLHHSVTTADGDMEGIPTVLMEAMATGLIVVSTRHSGIPELIDDGVDGYLVEERDTDAYVRCLEGLANADRDMPLRARAKIEERFNMTKQNEKLAGIYREVIGDAGV